MVESKHHVVVVGGGWAAVSLLSKLRQDCYRVTLISSTPFHTCTLDLPRVSTNTMAARQVVGDLDEYLVKPESFFMEGTLKDVDFDKKEVLVACGPSGREERVAYSTLIIAVGGAVNFYGVEGVKEYAYMLQSAEDALRIRRHLQYNLREAASPNKTRSQSRKLLTFVIMGAGYTGVEMAGMIAKMVSSQKATELPPELRSLVRIIIVERGQTCLRSLPTDVSEFVLKHFESVGVKVEWKFESTITSVGENKLLIQGKDGAHRDVEYGTLLWCAGLKQHFVVELLNRKLGFDGACQGALVVDQQLKVRGLEHVYALGDCAVMQPDSLLSVSDELFEKAKTFPYGAGTVFLSKKGIKESLWKRFPQLHKSKCRLLDFSRSDPPSMHLTQPEWTQLCTRIDNEYVPPPQRAIVAEQEGHYLAKALNQSKCGDNTQKAFVENIRGTVIGLDADTSVVIKGAQSKKKLKGGCLSGLIAKQIHAHARSKMKRSKDGRWAKLEAVLTAELPRHPSSESFQKSDSEPQDGGWQMHM
eukprot:GHVU01131082.1.p1 GENE.GHVU01131082.1~~GHVU01131082.1.p1  ORF type:complete len:529 (+),score=92.25 GHVU01131082.1:65-1651(+)